MAARSKDALEKNMLRTRTGGFQGHDEPGNPLVPEPASPMYADDGNRFQRDFAAEAHKLKEQQLRQHQVGWLQGPHVHGQQPAAVANAPHAC